MNGEGDPSKIKYQALTDDEKKEINSIP